MGQRDVFGRKCFGAGVAASQIACSLKQAEQEVDKPFSSFHSLHQFTRENLDYARILRNSLPVDKKEVGKEIHAAFWDLERDFRKAERRYKHDSKKEPGKCIFPLVPGQMGSTIKRVRHMLKRALDVSNAYCGRGSIPHRLEMQLYQPPESSHEIQGRKRR